MKHFIINKIAAELGKPINEESQVVYILSRIRKLMELDKNNKYLKLKFYCDWALHAELDRATSIFQNEFVKAIRGDHQALGPIITHQIFETEFLAFLKEYEVSTKNYEIPTNRTNFRRLLAEIYADTPLVVKMSTKAKITTNAGIFTNTQEGKLRIEIGFNLDNSGE